MGFFFLFLRKGYFQLISWHSCQTVFGFYQFLFHDHCFLFYRFHSLWYLRNMCRNIQRSNRFLSSCVCSGTMVSAEEMVSESNVLAIVSIKYCYFTNNVKVQELWDCLVGVRELMILLVFFKPFSFFYWLHSTVSHSKLLP